MRLAVRTDYALRVLMYAGLAQDRLVTVAEIAAAYGISANHLTAIVHRLAALGYLRTARGKGGGVRLARPPAAINLADVVRDLESDLALVECFGTGRCRIERACRLRGVLDEALEAFMSVLGRHTLADLLAPGPALAGLLGERAALPVTVGTA